MKKYKIALFIGRFQPFHKGHLYSLNKCFELAEKVIVGVGSSQESGTDKNPWNYEQRKRMIESLGEKIEIVGVPDLFNDEKWGGQIIDLIGQYGYQPSEVVGVGNNEWTNRIMRSRGIAVHETGLYQRDELEGIKIRELIKRQDTNWRDRVPSSVVKYIEDDKYAK